MQGNWLGLARKLGWDEGQLQRGIGHEGREEDKAGPAAQVGQAAQAVYCKAAQAGLRPADNSGMTAKSRAKCSPPASQSGHTPHYFSLVLSPRRLIRSRHS